MQQVEEYKKPRTSFPPMASNIFSSWTLSCWMLLIRMQGCTHIRGGGVCSEQQLSIGTQQAATNTFILECCNKNYLKKKREKKEKKLFLPKKWTRVNLSGSTHHFLHADVVGKQFGDDISVGQKHVANGLRRGERSKSSGAIPLNELAFCLQEVSNKLLAFQSSSPLFTGTRDSNAYLCKSLHVVTHYLRVRTL